jgi:hypothetical protein
LKHGDSVALGSGNESRVNLEGVKVVEFQPRTPTDASTARVTPWRRFKDWAEWGIGRLLNVSGVPGLVQPTAIEDSVAGLELSVKTTPLFTILSVNGRDFYFQRKSGRFDGTGTGCL